MIIRPKERGLPIIHRIFQTLLFHNKDSFIFINLINRVFLKLRYIGSVQSFLDYYLLILDMLVLVNSNEDIPNRKNYS